jgi:hypothetical protein
MNAPDNSAVSEVFPDHGTLLDYLKNPPRSPLAMIAGFHPFLTNDEKLSIELSRALHTILWHVMCCDLM